MHISENKIVSSSQVKIFKEKNPDKIFVFTNGCFDIVHIGHLDILQRIRRLGDYLIVGINTDYSVKKLKGEERPILPLDYRCIFLSFLSFVDFIVPFGEDTPYNIIKEIRPHYLIKGGDWAIENIVGQDLVKGYGGIVLSFPFTYKNISSSEIIKRIIEKKKKV